MVSGCPQTFNLEMVCRVRFPVLRESEATLHLRDKREEGCNCKSQYHCLVTKHMFENVLVAEDHEIANLSLRRTLDDLNVSRPDYAYYCDIALSKIKKALQTGQPYNLLVTDLYFEAEGSIQQLPDGAGLIKEAKV